MPEGGDERRPDNVARQRERFEAGFAKAEKSQWGFHYTADPLTRYLRDRRLHVALRYLEQTTLLPASEVRSWSAMTVCAGVGGEGTFLANQGFTDVTVADFSANSLALCNEFDPRLKTRLLNTEAMDLPDRSVDLVLVQDGLHHLPRPALGFTEMLRVARRAVVVIEPHVGLVGRLIGTRWEREDEDVNFVFRWNQAILEQVARSYLLDGPHHVRALRLWDHNAAMAKLVWRFPEDRRLRMAKLGYGALRVLLPRAGNMMVGVVLLDAPDVVARAGFGPKT